MFYGINVHVKSLNLNKYSIQIFTTLRLKLFYVNYGYCNPEYLNSYKTLFVTLNQTNLYTVLPNE